MKTSRVLDLGCGRAELALRIIERFGSTVVAIDRSSLMLDQARERAEWTGALGKLHLDDIDIRDFRADPETFHLTVMLGAGGIAGGMAGICQQVAGRWTRAGGYVLIGDGYWRDPRASRLPRGARRRHSEFLDHRGNVQAGIDAGLIADARGHGDDRRVGRVRVEVLPLDRALRARAARRPRRARDARAHRASGATPICAGAAIRWAFAIYLFYRPGARVG